MADGVMLFLLVVGILAIVTRETFLVVLIYLFGGVALLSNWWSNTIAARLVSARKFDHHAFPGEQIPVRVIIRNPTLLPAVWLQVQDSVPVELVEARTAAQIRSLGPRAEMQLTYQMRAQKRGLYTIGPLMFATGDLLGMAADRNSSAGVDTLIVYPRIIQFTQVPLPSSSPLGTIRHKQRIFEDPTRPFGKREYQTGDSLRRIDWKASASSGRLQTKIYEPSIALETMLFLNLNTADYLPKTIYSGTELAITTTASLAYWITGQRQASGLYCNGLDQRAAGMPSFIPAGKGRAHLMRVLEILACTRPSDGEPFLAEFRRQRVRLPWGTTALIISGSASLELLEELHQASRAGIHCVLILCGDHPDHHLTSQRARAYGIPVHVFVWEKDLDVWRK